ncbi:MAG: hypothetical protein FDZ75_02070 [Actinobacteria bacterium]|nr:MAG: hypothetical protein FDZ75_02070 [Actinomycetota bacterium]
MAENDTANNNWYGADGALRSGVGSSGTLASGDTDWLYFYVGTTCDAVVGYNTDTSGVQMTWYRFDGGTLVEQGRNQYDTSWSWSKRLEPGLYYVRMDDSAGRYTVTVTAPGLVQSPVAGSPTHGRTTPFSELYETALGWTRAVGPMPSDITHTSTLSNNQDTDWLYFYVGATCDAVVGYNAADSGVQMTWYRFDGGTLVEQGRNQYDHHWSWSKRLEPGLYYVRVDQGTGAYDVTVTGSGISASSVVGVPVHGRSTTASELYESPGDYSKATGPIASDTTCISEVSTNEDADWFYFYVSKTSDAVVGYNADASGIRMTWYRFNGAALVEQGQNQYDHHWSWSRRLEPGLYYVRMDGAAGAYDVTVTGAGIVTAKPKAALAFSSAPTALRKYAKGRFAAVLRPQHAAGLKSLSFSFERLGSDGRWTVVKKLSAVNVDGTASTVGAVYAAFAAPGRYRVWVRHSADGDHSTTISGPKYFGVK